MITDTNNLWISGGRLYTSGERFVVIMVLSLAIHLVLLLGVGFVVPEAKLSPPPRLKMEVALVANTPSEPDDVLLLAEHSQRGAGVSDTTHRQLPNSSEVTEDGVMHREQFLVTANAKQRNQDTHILTTIDGFDQVSIYDMNSETDVDTQQEVDEEVAPQIVWIAEEKPPWADARAYPRQKYLTAATRESEFAAYMAAWRNHVERVGNQYYPGWPGELVMDVAVRADGRVHSITVVRSSGNRSLDRAAVEIVNLSAPFMPFPASFRQKLDLLHLTRTWRFSNHLGLHSQ